MKVNIYETVQVRDEQRLQIARVLHNEPERPKKEWATRDELKSFIWMNGSTWAEVLAEEYAHLVNPQGGASAEELQGEDEDVLGISADDDEEDLIGLTPASTEPDEDEDVLGDVAVAGDPEGLESVL